MLRALCTRTKSNHQLRSNQQEFLIYPPAALFYFVMIRMLVESPFASQLMLKMLDGIAEIDQTPIKLQFLQRRVKHSACRSDEGTSFSVFLISRLLANHHESRGN